MEEAAIQCGFCSPGFILTAWEILESGKEYTDDELRKLLSGHLWALLTSRPSFPSSLGSGMGSGGLPLSLMSGLPYPCCSNLASQVLHFCVTALGV